MKKVVIIVVTKNGKKNQTLTFLDSRLMYMSFKSYSQHDYWFKILVFCLWFLFIKQHITHLQYTFKGNWLFRETEGYKIVDLL